jgi:hypothetical protein
MGLRMNKKVVLLVGVTLLLSCHELSAQQKLAQTGMKFLSVGGDPRIAAMGGAYTAGEGYASSVFYNPASMARITSSVDAMIGATLWIADINHGYGSIAIRPGDGSLGVFAISLQTVEYGDLIGTSASLGTGGGFVETGKFSPSAFAVGIGYAVALNEKLSIGGHGRYVRQSLGSFLQKANEPPTNFIGEVGSFDLGILYRTGYKSLNFGMSIRNFSKEIRYIQENFQLPLTFKMGLSMDMMDLFEIEKASHSLLLTVDAEHPRDYQEQVRVGGEYTFMKLFCLRAGYVSSANEEGISYGAGFMKLYDFDEQHIVGADYAYTPFGVFGGVHRFSFHISF